MQDFLFTPDRLRLPVKVLSGGERNRLLLAKVLADPGTFLILDEPTNHLDIDARQALIQALNGYEGCVILVSHDPHLVEAVADQLWLVKDGAVTPYNDDLEAYRKLIIQQRRDEMAYNRQRMLKELDHEFEKPYKQGALDVANRSEIRSLHG